MDTMTTSSPTTLSSASTEPVARSAYMASFAKSTSTATTPSTIIAIISEIHVVDFPFEYSHRLYNFLLNNHAVVFIHFVV